MNVDLFLSRDLELNNDPECCLVCLGLNVELGLSDDVVLSADLGLSYFTLCSVVTSGSVVTFDGDM